MVGNNVSSVLRSFEVVLPYFEALEYGKQLFVVGVVVALSVGKGVGMECNRVDVAIRGHGGDNASQGVVGGISFDEHGVVGRPMCKHRGFCKRFFQRAEGGIGLVRPIPRSAFTSKAGKWNYDIRIIKYETAVEIGEAKE